MSAPEIFNGFRSQCLFEDQAIAYVSGADGETVESPVIELFNMEKNPDGKISLIGAIDPTGSATNAAKVEGWISIDGTNWVKDEDFISDWNSVKGTDETYYMQDLSFSRALFAKLKVVPLAGCAAKLKNWYIGF
jgi:hypothetical protein